MTSPYARALEDKRAKVLANIQELRQEGARISAELGLRENQLKNIDDLLALEDGGRYPAKGEEPDLRPGSLADLAFEVLVEEGKPLHYREMVRLLTERSVHVPGKDPGANLISHLSRDERFGRASRGTYGLSEWPSVRTASKPRRRTRTTRRRTRRA